VYCTVKNKETRQENQNKGTSAKKSIKREEEKFFRGKKESRRSRKMFFCSDIQNYSGTQLSTFSLVQRFYFRGKAAEA
jgi:hypothetical protein